MRYRFVFTDWFNRGLKRLSCRNPHMRADFETFLAGFDAEAHPIIPHSGGARKARMKLRGRGKRSGYRVVYYFAVQNTVWLIAIYDKVQQENLSPTEQSRIKKLIQTIKEHNS